MPQAKSPNRAQPDDNSGDGGPQTQVQIRLPPDMLRRVDAHATELERRTPGIKFSRSDAIKNLLTIAFETLTAK